MEQLITPIRNLNIDRYVAIAGSTFWLYDYLLTCGYEVTRIWPTRVSLVKVLYMTNRYIAVPYLGLVMYYMLGIPAESQSQTFCRFYTISSFVMREFELVAATWLMLIRVRALYARFRWAGWLLYTTFIITHLLNAAFGVHSIVETDPSLLYLSLLRVCLSVVPTYMKVMYFIQIPFELLLLGMQLLHYWKLSLVISPVKPTPLLTALYTDGVLYFGATVGVRVWAGLCVILLDPTLWYMTVAIDLATTSTFISRIFLHLNEISSKQEYGISGLTTTATSATLQVRSTSTPVDSWMEMEPHQRSNCPPQFFQN